MTGNRHTRTTRRPGRFEIPAAPRTATVICLLSLSLPALAAPPLPSVVVVEPELQSVAEQVPLTGTVMAPRVARLSPEVSGLVASIEVDAGDRIVTGDTLLTLDTALARLAVDAAAAGVELAREELADARRRLSDAERLRKSRGIPETEVEARRSEVRADAATLKLREAEAQRERERLKRFTLSAPFDGVISAKHSEQGEWVTPGDRVLDLVAVDDLRIDFRVPQRYFPRITPTARISVRLPSLPGRVIAARIGNVIPVSDETSRSFLIRAHPQDAGLTLTHGMSASGTLALPTGERQLVVPRDALLRHPDGRTTVWVVGSDADEADVSEHQVETGIAFDGLVVVRSGLAVGDRVVVEGNEALRQGQRVRIGGQR